jgi:two-component system response regulator PilR (NtrC family)
LYYRLNVIQLKMPSLRDRPEDIPELMQKLLQKICTAQSIDVPVIEDSAQKLIAELQFAGNVRELENMLERALALCDGHIITTDDLFMYDEAKLNKPAGNQADQHDFDSSKSAEFGLPEYLEDIEKRAIIKALEKSNNNKTAAAKLLGVSFRTLRYRLTKLGLAKDEASDLEEDE